MSDINISVLPERSETGALIVHIALTGTLTGERYRFLEDTLSKLAETHNRIRLLMVLEGLEGLTSGATERDLRFEQRFAPYLERAALVCAFTETGGPRESGMPFSDVKARWFSRNDMDSALQWLKSD
jgi:hypothetical protein